MHKFLKRHEDMSPNALQIGWGETLKKKNEKGMHHSTLVEKRDLFVLINVWRSPLPDPFLSSKRS